MPDKEYEFGSAKRQKSMGRPEGRFSGEKARNGKKSLKDLFVYCKRYVPAIVISLILGAAGAIFSLIGPGKLSDITDVITEGLRGAIDIDAIVSICTMLAFFYAFSWIFSYVQHFILATVTQKVSKSLRSDISKKINRLPLKYFDSTSTGDVLSRVTNDVDTIGQTMNNSLGSLISSITLFLGALLKCFSSKKQNLAGSLSFIDHEPNYVEQI